MRHRIFRARPLQGAARHGRCLTDGAPALRPFWRFPSAAIYWHSIRQRCGWETEAFWISYMMRALVVGILVWLGLIVAGAAIGGGTSFYTGMSSPIPRWNGWSYFTFCAQEGAKLAAVLTWPVAFVVFCAFLVSSRRTVA